MSKRAKIREQLTYANVMVTILAVLVLGGGVAYGAAQLGKNTVGAKQLKRGAVSAAKLRNGAVTPRKLNRRARRSLRGAKGPRGPAGPAGPPGNPAAIGFGAVGTANVSATIPAARVTHDEVQNVKSDSLTTLQFDEERYDTANLHDPGQSARLTAPVAGVYLITANVEWSGEGPGIEAKGARTVAIVRNGKTLIASDREGPSDFDGIESAENVVQTIATQALLGPGDYVDARVHHSQPEDITIASFSGNATLEISPEFAMTWLAPGPGG